ncbi:hypothetical protein INR49_012455 [Caranx melampygus]|nr:hypothetical protein INR49_012455 [Caranx melampygus]
MKPPLTVWSRSLALVKCNAVVNTNTDRNQTEVKQKEQVSQLSFVFEPGLCLSAVTTHPSSTPCIDIATDVISDCFKDRRDQKKKKKKYIKKNKEKKNNYGADPIIMHEVRGKIYEFSCSSCFSSSVVLLIVRFRPPLTVKCVKLSRNLDVTYCGEVFSPQFPIDPSFENSVI